MLKTKLKLEVTYKNLRTTLSVYTCDNVDFF